MNDTDQMKADQENIACPHCGGGVQKFGKSRTGAQRYRCTVEGCRRQFVPGADHLIDPEIKSIVLRMIGADVHPRKIYQSINGDDKELISLRWIYELKRKVKNGGIG